MTAPAPTIRVEDIASHPGYQRLADVRGIEVDLRYAGANNFAGRVLYRDLDCAWLRREAAQGLAEAAQWLARRRPGWRLRVLDALRPQRVQEAIWADIEGSGLEDYFAHPARGSIHSYGMAVDVTLVDERGVEADMGSGFDEMHERSHPALHAEHLARGVLSAAQVAERDCLRDAMAAGGFAGISTEWWHFNHGSSDAVRRMLPRVL
jgi:zinc D-Ala-D-Ala dipeptidase